MIKHLAFIMDGNRRWAKKHHLLPWQGHQEGVKTVKEAIKIALRNDIKYLTLYLFSIENFKRSEEEKNYLFSVIAQKLEKNVPKYNEMGVQVRFIGDSSLFPEPVIDMCNRTAQLTAGNDKLILNLLFCYGGQQEIVAGVKNCIQKVQDGSLDPNDLNEKTFNNYLWLGDIPAPDIIVRTGGCNRLSNFLLYQVAYSEFLFLNKFWPELTSSDMQHVIEEFNDRQRNFGT